MERLPIRTERKKEPHEPTTATNPQKDELEIDLNLEKLDLTYSSGEPRIL